MMERKYLAVFTDLHVVEPNSKLTGMDTNMRAARAIDSLVGESLPELAVCLGDLADTTVNPDRETATASQESYEHARNLLKGLRVPLLTIPGNHDIPALLDSAFPSPWMSKNHGVCRYSFHGVELIAIDARTGPEPTGIIQKETLKELDAALAQSSRAMIFSHFPLFDLDNTRITSDLSVINREQIVPIIERYQEKILGCFNGHLHIWASTFTHGIPVTCVPSATFSFSLEPM